MEDSDSGVTSMSSGHGTSSSMGGDDRSGAGSRSSAASLAFSEVSSPAPTQLFSGVGQQQQQQPLALTVPRASSTEPVRVWRDPQLLESSPVVRHIHSLQHHALMAPGGGHYDEEKTTSMCRDRAVLGRGTRDMERGKDVDRERMVHIQRERERDADREAEQAVDKHFAESLKKYQSQMPWSINTIPLPHGMATASAAATESSPPPPPRSTLGAGISPSLSISSIPATSSVALGSLNISPSSVGSNNSNKKGFVKTSSGNISKSSDSVVGHVMDHHSRVPADVIGLSAAAARNGVPTMAHYEQHYLPPPSASQILAAEEQRRARMERDRIIMADRELESDQMRMHHQQQQQHREREKEMDRIRHLEQQRASYYGAQANVHRSPSSSSSTSSIGGGTTNGNNKSATSSISVIPTSSPASAASNNHHHNNGGPAGNPSSVSIDYAHHRGLTISPSMKHVDNKPPQQGHPSMYAYQQQQQQHLYHQSLAYHKDAKGKPEMSLPAPPPLLSDVKSSGGGGVIVKHDTGPMNKSQQQMPSSLQVIPTSSMGQNNNNNSKSLPSPNHYKTAQGPPMSQSQLLFEYRNPTTGSGQPNIVSIHAATRDQSPHNSNPPQMMIYTDGRYKQSYPGQPPPQNPHQQQQQQQQRQSPSSGAYSQQRQNPSPKQIPPPNSGYGPPPSQNKPKVSSPAPAHIYGKPESGPAAAGIMSGIPVCRANSNYSSMVMPSVHVVSSKPSAISVESSRVTGGSVTYQPPPPGPLQRNNYGASGPPPAHSSRVFEAPSAWPYGSSAPPPHSSLVHSASPVSISVNPSPASSTPASSLNRRSPSGSSSLQVPGGRDQMMMNTHASSGHSISISTASVSLSHVVPDVQTQPLDLGTSDRSRDSMHSNHSSESKSPPAHHSSVTGSMSLKRKSNTPIHYHQSPPMATQMGMTSSAAKKRFEFIPQQSQLPSQHYHNNSSSQYPPTQQGSSGIPPHPSYSVYQSGPGSVAIHPIPGPPSQSQSPHQQLSVSNRKDLNPLKSSSVVVSVAGNNNNNESNSTPMHHQHHHQQKSMPMEGTREIYKGQSGTAIVTAHPVVSNNNSITITRSEEQQKQQQQTSALTITASSIPPPVVTNVKAIVVNNINSNSSPGTNPVKLPIAEPAKAVSPVPKFSSSGPRNLKKAWLQRHSGEDSEDKVVPSGDTVKTNGINNGNGLTSATTTATPAVLYPETTVQSSPIKSLSSVGSMAVNSVVGVVLDNLPPSNGNKVPQHPKKTAVLLNSSETGKNKMQVDTDSDAKEESSSSDQEHTIKTPPKKKQAKTKRKKGGGRKPIAKKKPQSRGAANAVTTAAASESDKNSDSEKESASDKDSDSGTSTSQGKLNRNSNGSVEKTSPAKSADVSERRKRGRRPKVPAKDKDVPLKKKQSRPGQANTAAAPSVVVVAATGGRGRPKSPAIKTFLQEKACHEMVEKLPKCRECRLPTDQRMKAFCRFYAFRRLRYTKHGQLAVSGFSDPKKNPSTADRRLWEANRTNPPTDLDLPTAMFILSKISLQLCNMLSSEMSVWNEHKGGRRAWKKVVNGMREMCDVCETTLFNLHWSCNKCGLAVCLDCCRSRRDGLAKSWSESEKDCDEYRWLLCTNGSVHDPNKLTSTQIMTGNTMGQMDKELHHVCNLFDIKLQCACMTSTQVPHEMVELALRTVYFAEKNGMKPQQGQQQQKKVVDQRMECDSPLSVLADVALQQNSRKSKGPDKASFDHEMLKICLAALRKYPNHQKPVIKKEPVDDENDDEDDDANYKVLPAKVKTEVIPIRVMSLNESKLLYPDTPHSWLCDGKLLRLHDPMNPNNYKMFQEQWTRCQPVLVSDVTKKLDRSLWTPESFSADFGDKKNDVVNCINGDIISMPMKKFWDGFDTAKRQKDDKGQPMLLKLKDWPPDENFATMLPERFDDLMAALPLPDYTHRNGRLNLAGRLPSCFVRPDLGPKMYNAYGSALHPTKGTTNLHMDISDAVNVMVYVGIPTKGVHTEETKEAFRAIDEAGCDILTRRRVRDKGEMPGALWHIYAPQDADKIRKLLKEVAQERGEKIEPDSDPIHDQNWYLDGPLRERLYKSYGVEGYPIAQCLGDAIFIPAGAPHQVRNLHNCIKVAEDFVSPENISNCFQLTHEFRQLSDSHQNHEDKLQIKNIIYHAAKDVLSYLYVRLKKAEEWGVPPDEEYANWKSAYEPWLLKPKEEAAGEA